MNIGMYELGKPGAASAPQLNVENSNDQGPKTDPDGLNIKIAALVCKVGHSKSEDNLFCKKYLSARYSSRLKGNQQQKISKPWEALIDEIHIPVENENDPDIGKKNKCFICKYASDTLLKPLNIPDIPQQKDEVRNEEIDILSFTPDEHENWSQKYKNWYKNADCQAITGWMMEVSKNGFDLQLLAKCSLRQRAVIAQYVSQMLKYRYKVSFVKEVFNSMIMLYTTKIYGYTLEECLPEFINPEDYDRDNPINRSPLTFDDRYMQHREWIAKRLAKLIEFCGGDYSIIAKYYHFQQRDSSWCETSRILKGFYLAQKIDTGIDKSYFLIGGVTWSMTGPKKWEFGVIAFIAEFYAKYPPDSPEYIAFFKTIAIYQGFVAIAFNYIDGIVGLDRKRGMLTVYRVSSRHYIPGQLQGILDSTSLGRFLGFLFEENSTMIELLVPLCDVKFAYFLSRELCDHGGLDAEECEMLCDMSNALIFDRTVVDVRNQARIIIVNQNNAGEVGININGIRAYITSPYLVNLEPDKQAVFLYDRYHFWEDRIKLKVGEKEYPGYTDNPKILQIAQKAAAGESLKEYFGEVFV